MVWLQHLCLEGHRNRFVRPTLAPRGGHLKMTHKAGVLLHTRRLAHLREVNCRTLVH